MEGHPMSAPLNRPRGSNYASTDAAIARVACGESISAAARAEGVPLRTLFRALKRKKDRARKALVEAGLTAGKPAG